MKKAVIAAMLVAGLASSSSYAQQTPKPKTQIEKTKSTKQPKTCSEKDMKNCSSKKKAGCCAKKP